LDPDKYHLPVMTDEAVAFLNCRSGGVYIDCTLGGGGHGLEILKASSPAGRLIGIDRDADAVRQSRKTFANYLSRVSIVHSNFKRLKDLASERRIRDVDGILVDLGISSHQLDSAGRGFSLMKEGPLDMRMNQESGESAADLLKRLTVEELDSIFRDYGEERWSRRIAEFIKSGGEPETTLELAALVERAVPKKFYPKKIHVATRVFQALRIAVNEELASLDHFIEDAVSLLKKGGRLVMISFHSLEDRIVKNVFNSLAFSCLCPPDLPYCRCERKNLITIITKKPVVPTNEEIRNNPRARSAKMRVAECL